MTAQQSGDNECFHSRLIGSASGVQIAALTKQAADLTTMLLEKNARGEGHGAGREGPPRDLSVSYNKIGDVLVAQGNLPEALKTFRDGLAIADRLAKSDPGSGRPATIAAAYPE
jgi:hypothetical protein